MIELISPQIDPESASGALPQSDPMDGLRVSYYQRAMERRLRKAGIPLVGIPLIARPAVWQKGARVEWVTPLDDEPEPVAAPAPRVVARRSLLAVLAERMRKRFRLTS